MAKHMLDLLDYRRRTFELYRQIREMGTDAPAAFDLFKGTRDTLFRDQTQSPLDGTQKATFTGLNYHPYNPAYRVLAELNNAIEARTYDVDLGDDGHFSMRLVGTVTFQLPRGDGELGVFWIEGYGGGIFIPFRDATNGDLSYGGGRYLYDTIKGADQGMIDGKLVLDFNYSYHPSCYYNPRWVCPLAPPQNHLTIPIEAGEKSVAVALG